MFTQPLCGGKLGDEGLIEAMGIPVVDVLDGGGSVPQGGLAQAGLETTGVAVGTFAVDQEPEALFEGERVDVGHLQLFLKRLCHAGHAQAA